MNASEIIFLLRNSGLRETRELFIRHFIDAKTSKQIVEIVNLSVSTVQEYYKTKASNKIFKEVDQC